jgi:flavin-dependent dehydrogenase
MASSFDVVIVGASVAGCTAATFFGRHGLRVALLERSTDHRAYKKVCTHYIQASATPTLARLGLIDAIEAAGGVRNWAELMLPAGWVPNFLEEHGYNIRRQKLDPMLRALAAETPGVELMLGHTVTDLIVDGGRPAGVRAKSEAGAKTLRAPLVVAADGRHGKMGALAGVEARVSPHERFFYYAYYRNLRLAAGTRSMIWFSTADAAYCFPNDDGLTLVLAAPLKANLPAWREDLEGSFAAHFASLSRGPNLAEAERVGDILGMIETPNHQRAASAPGIAFVGDAAMTSDPLWGVGCGWAMQSAEWLVDSVAPALRRKGGVAPAEVDAGLAEYRNLHAARLDAHHAMICDLSTGRAPNVIERLIFDACTKDEVLARGFARIGTRIDHPSKFLGPRTLARALWVSATRRKRLPLPA